MRMSEEPLQALDPQHYVEHVTRTALLLEQLARDVKALREQNDTFGRGTEGLRTTVSALEKDLALCKLSTTTEVGACKETVRALEEKLRWVSRLLVGALITGIVSGTLALVWKAVAG